MANVKAISSASTPSAPAVIAVTWPLAPSG